MAFFAKLGAGILLVFGSLWSGTLGVLHLPGGSSIDQSVASTTIQTDDKDFKWTKDNDHVYADGNIIHVDTGGPAYGKEPDARTFSYVGGSYGYYYFKDKNFAYATTWQEFAGIADVDPTTFTSGAPLYPFAKDKKNVFFVTSAVSGADPTTFMFVGFASTTSTFYAKDATQVFYHWGYGSYVNTIQGADAKTFEVIVTSDFDAQDKNHKYLQGKIVQ